jgi:CRP/FNR family transcriptional regulator, nitrogen fixation regulation protein
MRVMGTFPPTSPDRKAYIGRKSWRQLGATRRFAGNVEIYRQHEPAEYLYQLVTGAVQTFDDLLDGSSLVDEFYLPGEIFGLESGNQHAFSAKTLQSSNIVLIKRALVESEVLQNIDFAIQLQAATANELGRKRQHLALLGMNARERVAGFLLDLSERAGAIDEIELPMFQQDIANYLRVSLETVCRMLSLLQKCGAIDMQNRRQIVLRNRALLSELVASPSSLKKQGRRIRNSAKSGKASYIEMIRAAAVS